MADYAGRLAATRFDELVAGIRQLLSTFDDDYLPIIDREDDGILDRLDLTLDHVLVVTSTALPSLVPRVWIDDLAQALKEVEESLRGLEGLDAQTITVPLVNRLSEAVENLAKELMQWPPRAEAADWREVVTQAASTYRRSAGQQLAALYAEIDQAKADAEALRQEFEGLTEQTKAETRAQVESISQNFKDLAATLQSMQQQASLAESQVARSVERVDRAIAEHQQQFSQAQEDRSKDFQARMTQLMDNSAAQLAQRRDAADAALAAIQQQVDEAAELVSVFAAAGTANAYSKEAKDQAKLADNWRYAAIGLGVVAAVAAISLFFGHTGNNPAWALIIGKLAVGIAFGGLASYAARQSSSHRRREETARHLELNIAAFGPFVRELDGQGQLRARAKVVDAIFLRKVGGDGPDGEGAPALSDDHINLLGKLLEMIKSN